MKSYILAALIGSLTYQEVAQAIKLENAKHIRLQKINILAQTNAQKEEGKGAGGQPDATVKAEIPTGPKESKNEAQEKAKLAPGEKAEPKAKAEPEEGAGQEAQTKKAEDGSKENAEKDKEAKEQSLNAAAEDKKKEEEETGQTPGQKAAVEDVKNLQEALPDFPSTTDCAPLKNQVQHWGLVELDGIRGKSREQLLLKGCQDKWLWERENKKEYIKPSESLEEIAKKKAEVERLAEKSEWHQDNWNVWHNPENDRVQKIINDKKEETLKQQQEIESFIIYPTDTPDIMKEKAERIEKRNQQRLAQAKAEFDADLDAAYKLKLKEDAQKKLSDQMQKDEDERREKEHIAKQKAIEDAEVVESEKGLKMREILDARKQINQERIDELDKQHFNEAMAAKEHAEQTYDKVHAEYKSVQAAIKYSNERTNNWRQNSLKTTNDEIWTENMPPYVISESDPAMRATLEKEYRMAQKAAEKAPVKKEEDEKKEEKKDEKKEEKKEEKKDDKKESKEEKKEPTEEEAKAVEAKAKVENDNAVASNGAAETDDQMKYAEFKVEAQNKRDQREAAVKH